MGLTPTFFEPGLEALRSEVWSVIGREIVRVSVLKQQIERLEDILAVHLGADRGRESFPRVFVDRRQHFVGATVAQAVMNEVHAPDVIRILWT